MTQMLQYLSLFFLPLVFLFSYSGKTYAQCPVVPLFTYSTTCQADFEISFTNASTAPGGQIASYFWDFGDGSTSTATDPTHIFPGAGTYSVYLFVYDTSSCYDSIFQNVVASELPVSSFGTTVTGCGQITFNNTSTYDGGGPVWYWDFGDPASGANNNSSLQSPQHTFTNAGTYNVMLALTDAFGCSDTIWQLITINEPLADFSWDSTCAFSPTYFTDLSSSVGDPIVSWYWTFGDGSISTTQSPSHIYASGGVKSVSLTVTTSSGCTANIVQFVSINFPPTADFDYSVTCWGDSTVFTDMSSFQGPGQFVSWTWDFGDGNSSALQNPVHTYTLASIYTVTLTVRDTNDCSATVSKIVEVFIPPIANFSATSECFGDQTFFTDLSIGNPLPIVSWDWNFGDGFTSASQNPVYLYALPGIYYVTLTVVNQEGCADTFADSVEVFTNPVALFEADTVCVGGTTSFTDLSQPTGQIVSWQWDFGDPASGANNNSSLQNPLHIFGLAGTYSVTLEIIDANGCTHLTTQDVWVEPSPIANFSYLNESCVGELVLFNDLSIPGNEDIIIWVWDFGDGTTETIYFPANPSVTHIYTSSGILSVTLTVESAMGCIGTITKTINIVPVPAADFTYTTACEDMATQFTDNSSLNGGTGIITWWWDFGDPLSGAPNNSFFQNPDHLFTGPGTYNVTLIVWNSDFCSDTIIQTIIVHPKPPIDFYYDPVCEGFLAQFYTDVTVVNVNTIVSYLWDFGDGGFSNLQNPVHLFGGAGSFNVKFTITDTSLCENTIIKIVNVDTPPVAFFDVTEPTCSGDSMWFDDLSSTTYGYIQTWVWDFDDGSPLETIQFPDDPNAFHVYNTPGTYGPTLTVTNSQGCSHTYTRIVDIDEKPYANFHWSANPCQDEEVQFTDASFPNGTGNIITWEWEFDDPLSGTNNNSSQENPVHVFTDGGIFFVRLIVTNFNDCRDTIIKPVHVNDSPEVAFLWYGLCEDTLTYFYPDSSIMNPSSVISWFWDFGDGQFSTSPTPAHNYEVSGYYNVTLTIQDTGICTSSLTQEIFINASPEALFDVSDITCMNSPVYFDDLSSVASSYIIRWHWDFGDGTDTTIYFPGIPDVEHTYALDGTYLVSLSVVSEDSCYADASIYLVIEAAPIALFYFDPACFSTPTQFWDNSSMGGGFTIVSWFWDFGDPASAPANTSTLQNPIHDFSGPGIFDVSLTVTNVDGCTDLIMNQVPVYSGAPVDFYSIDTCHNLETWFYLDLAITDTNTILVYDWDFGDGSPHSNLMNPVHMYDAVGIYDVTLVIYDTNGCSNAVIHDVEVRANPVALFDFETACTDDSTYFIDISYAPSGDQIVSWEWNFDDPASGANNTSTLQDPVHVFDNNTLYDVKLVITTDYGCKDSVMIPVTVHAGPESDFIFNIEYCQSGQVYFDDISTSVHSVIVGWEWYFEPGSYSYIPNPTYYFLETDTTYNVSLMVTDANGCTDEITLAVYVPDAFALEMNFSQACVFNEMSFGSTILQPAGDSIFSYAWNFGDPASGPYNYSYLADPVHTYNIPGYFTVTLTAIDIHGCPITIYDQVYVDDLPVPDFLYESILCDSIINLYDNSFGNGAPIQSWLWEFGDGSPPELIVTPPGSTQHFYEYEGVYDVTLTVINGLECENTITKEVEVGPCIHSDFIVLNSPVCERNNIYFSDSSGIEWMIEKWEWDFGDGNDTVYYAKADVIHHYYETAGEFEVILTVSALFYSQVISDTYVRSVTIHPTPLTRFFCDPVCIGETSMFYDSTEHSTGSFIASWSWSFGTGLPGDTSNLKNPVFKYDTAGLFDVILVTVNQYGCSDTLTQQAEVNYNPIADFELTTACKGNRIYFTDLSDGFDADVVAWSWYFNDPFRSGDTSDQQHPHWTYAEEGTYTPSLIIKNENGCRDTALHNVLVNPVPLAAFDLFGNQDDMQGAILLEDLSEDAIEYVWNFGDGYELWGNIPPITHLYEDEGEYELYLVVWNEFDCPDTAYSEYGFMFKTLFIPNALCPDDNNPQVQIFQPVGRNLQDFYIAIHDTWGNLLWESTKLDRDGRPVEFWDGTYQAIPMPPDVYIWRATARFKDGTIWEGTVVGDNTGSSGNTSGTVTLVR